MPVFLIQVRDFANHPQKDVIRLNVMNIGIKTGDSVEFGHAGIVKRTANREQVFQDVTRGVRDVAQTTVRQIGPVNMNSDTEHVHWRIVAVREFRLKYKPGEVDIIDMHQRGEI